MSQWNPWHGCHKYSEGCANCYVYRRDNRYSLDASKVYMTKEFDLPVKRKRGGAYSLTAAQGVVYTCFTSDFFLEDADLWRAKAWSYIAERRDLDFLIITKRILRFNVSLPSDWGEGYPNVAICCTAENQKRADERLPYFLSLPIKHKMIVCEPLLGHIDLSAYLSPDIEKVVAGGESGPEARVCRHEWICSIKEQCDNAGVDFWFKQTGARYEKDGRVYNVPRRLQSAQARKSGL